MAKLRVLVVEDSLTVRKRIVETLAADPSIEIAGEAEDGRTAIEMCEHLRPNAVTLDMMLPVLSGLAVTEYIMAYFPTPILIVSASVNRGELYKTYDALAAGALDVLEKPNGDEVCGEWEQRLISAVKLIARIKVITHPRGRFNRDWQYTGGRILQLRRPENLAYRLVAIGASTGGPAALVQILHALPPDFPLPVFLVNHIGPAFGRWMSEWLDGQSRLRVSCAVDGEPLPEVGRARVIMAPPGRHMVIEGGRVRLVDGAERHSCRPSIDVFFESVAAAEGPRSVACLLTGMGKDGAAGLLSIRQSGGRTLAQDEATSCIFGMPQEAIRIGAAERVLGLPEFAPMLVSLAMAGAAPPKKERSNSLFALP